MQPQPKQYPLNQEDLPSPGEHDSYHAVLDLQQDNQSLWPNGIYKSWKTKLIEFAEQLVQGDRTADIKIKRIWWVRPGRVCLRLEIFTDNIVVISRINSAFKALHQFKELEKLGVEQNIS